MATAEFDDAADAAGGAWMPPRLYADWNGDGVTTIDGTVPPFLRYTNWPTTVAGGYGTTETGQAWTTAGTATFGVVAEDKASIVLASTSAGIPARAVLDSGSRDFNMVVPVVRDATVVAGAPLTFWLIGRYADADNFSFVKFIIGGGTLALELGEVVGGSFTATLDSADLTHSEGTWCIRFTGGGPTLKARAWNTALGVEPVDRWHVDTSAGSTSVTGTMVGFGGRRETGNTNAPYTFQIPADPGIRVLSGALDDLSRQVGGWEVSHHLDDGLPDQVTHIAGIGVPELGADIGPPPAYVSAAGPMEVDAWASPYNIDSPLYGLERDTAPLTLDVGLVTTNGPEYVRVFTGQMMDLKPKNGSADLTGTSAARMNLRNLVQPPAAYGLYQGANATWPISYALHACDVRPSPPPQTGCRYWAPMHGSVRPFIPGANTSVVDPLVLVNGNLGPSRTAPIQWIDGPFVAAFDGSDGTAGYNGGRTQRLFTSGSGNGIDFEAGAALVSSTAKGKVELWVKGVATSVVTTVVSVWMQVSGGQYVRVGINGHNRLLFCDWYDGVNLGTFTHGTPLPTDDEWHFVGFAWDIAAEDRWINLDGSVATSTSSAIDPALFPASEVWAANYPTLSMQAPVAELQITAGVSAADHVGWLNTLEGVTWSRGAVLNRSSIELSSIAWPVAKEAWAAIGEYAQAELASLRATEDDTVEYLTQGWWVKDDQQAITEIISTEVNAGRLRIHSDPTKIRNQIQVTYTDTLNVDTFGPVLSLRDGPVIRPGVQTWIIPTEAPAVEVRGFSFTYVTTGSTAEPFSFNTVSINTASDGSGTYADSSQVSITISSWEPGSVTLSIINYTGTTYYLANNKGWPSLLVSAKYLDEQQAAVVESDATSIAVRGTRALEVQAPALQSRVDARRLARLLVMALRFPNPAIEEPVQLFGDPRRRPGQLVTVDDRLATRASGQWRIQTVIHEGNGEGGYEQKARIRPALPIAYWGDHVWGASLWGPTDD